MALGVGPTQVNIVLPTALERDPGALPRVVVEDHNFGGIHELGPSFAEFLENGLLGAGQQSDGD